MIIGSNNVMFYNYDVEDGFAEYRYCYLLGD